jgi:hypothetical protein
VSRRVKMTLGALLLAFTLTSGVGVVAYQTADAFGLLGALITRTVVQTASLKDAEKRDRSNINKRRDAELAEVDLRVQAVAVQEEKGWLSAETAVRERERYDRLSEAITERAKRERQITSYQTRHRIRENIGNTFIDVVKVATGADPRAVDFLAGLLQGKKPLAAAIDAAVSGGQPVADPRQPFRDLEAQLQEVKKAAQALGGAKGIAVRARVDQMLRETTGIAEGEGEPPDDVLQRLTDLEEAAQAAVSQAGDIAKDLFPGSEGISRTRFAGEERFDQLDAAVAAEQGPLAGRVLISSLLRNALNDVEELAGDEGLTLTQDQIDAMARTAVGLWQEQRKRAADSDEVLLPFDELLRAAVNEILATGGEEPLAEESPEPSDEEDVQPPTDVVLTLEDLEVVFTGCPDPKFPDVCHYDMVITFDYVTPVVPAKLSCTGEFLSPAAERDLSFESGSTTITVSRTVLFDSSGGVAVTEQLQTRCRLLNATGAVLGGDVLVSSPVPPRSP